MPKSDSYDELYLDDGRVIEIRRVDEPDRKFAMFLVGESESDVQELDSIMVKPREIAWTVRSDDV